MANISRAQINQRPINESSASSSFCKKEKGVVTKHKVKKISKANTGTASPSGKISKVNTGPASPVRLVSNLISVQKIQEEEQNTKSRIMLPNMLFFNDPNKALNGKQTPRRSYLAAALSNKPIDSSSIMMKPNSARQSSETRNAPTTKELITITNQQQTTSKLSLFPQSTKKETGLLNVKSQKNIEKVNSEAVPFQAKGRSSLHQ